MGETITFQGKMLFLDNFKNERIHHNRRRRRLGIFIFFFF
jgi:hypothetical protein